MKKSSLIISVILIVAVIAIGIIYLAPSSKSSSANIVSENATAINSSSETVTQDGAILPTDLSKHNSESDCWVAFEGKVYDITSFLPKHPGSAAAILPYCGTSTAFENAFIAKHGRTKVQLLMMVGRFMGDFKTVGNLS